MGSRHRPPGGLASSFRPVYAITGPRTHRILLLGDTAAIRVDLDHRGIFLINPWGGEDVFDLQLHLSAVWTLDHAPWDHPATPHGTWFS